MLPRLSRAMLSGKLGGDMVRTRVSPSLACAADDEATTKKQANNVARRRWRLTFMLQPPCSCQHTLGRTAGQMWRGRTATSIADLLFEPVVCVGFVVERGDLDIACGSVQADRFHERLVRLES